MSYQQSETVVLEVERQDQHQNTVEYREEDQLPEDLLSSVPIYQTGNKNWCASFFSRCCNKSESTIGESEYLSDEAENGCCPTKSYEVEDSQGSCCFPNREEEALMKSIVSEGPDETKRCVMF